MLIREEALTHWVENFYGYGSWQAKLWFVAHEEGSGDLPQEVADKFNYFYHNHAPGTPPGLCDIRDMYKQVCFSVTGPRADLFTNLHDYRFGKHAVLHGWWKNIIAFAHGYRNESSPDLLRYQQKELALPSKKREAMIRLFPLPAHNHAWYYSWLDMPKLTYLRTRAEYQEHVHENRIQTILEQMKRHQPEVVVMYGMENINRLKKSVQDQFPKAKFKIIKAIARQIPQHHRADLDGTILILTTQIPALRHNRVETGFDWGEFGRSILGT